MGRVIPAERMRLIPPEFRVVIKFVENIHNLGRVVTSDSYHVIFKAKTYEECIEWWTENKDRYGAGTVEVIYVNKEVRYCEVHDGRA